MPSTTVPVHSSSWAWIQVGTKKVYLSLPNALQATAVDFFNLTTKIWGSMATKFITILQIEIQDAGIDGRWPYPKNQLIDSADCWEKLLFHYYGKNIYWVQLTSSSLGIQNERVAKPSGTVMAPKTTAGRPGSTV